MTEPIYHRFLGAWALDIDTCDFEQGDPPTSATYRIEEAADEIVFHLSIVDAGDTAHELSFRGKPDGVAVSFNGGPLADALKIEAVSDQQLDSSAIRDGIELMTATRTLSSCGASMEIVQTVTLPDMTQVTNRSTYLKVN